MGIFDRNPAAVFLANIVSCEDCPYPCNARERSSQANCEEHMSKLLQDGKIHILIQWKDTLLKETEIKEK